MAKFYLPIQKMTITYPPIHEMDKGKGGVNLAFLLRACTNLVDVGADSNYLNIYIHLYIYKYE